MTELGLTPSQTSGPYLEIGLLGGPISSRLVDESDPRAIRVSGVLLDGAGDPVPDGLIEIWQANPAGRYAHPADDREEHRARERLLRLRAFGHAGGRSLRARDREAGAGALGGRTAAGAPPPRRRLRTRPPQAGRDAHVLPRRGRSERGGPRAARARAGARGRRSWPGPRTVGSASTSCSRAPGRRRSSPCDALLRHLRAARASRGGLGPCVAGGDARRRACSREGRGGSRARLRGGRRADRAGVPSRSLRPRASRRGGTSGRESGGAARPGASCRGRSGRRRSGPPGRDEPGHRGHGRDARRATGGRSSYSRSSTGSPQDAPSWHARTARHRWPRARSCSRRCRRRSG